MIITDADKLPKPGSFVKIQADLGLLTGNETDKYFVTNYQGKIGLVLATKNLVSRRYPDKYLVCVEFGFPKTKHKVRWFHVKDLAYYRDSTQRSRGIAKEHEDKIPEFGQSLGTNWEKIRQQQNNRKHGRRSTP